MVADALASLVLDRFVSASSAEDAHSSLERILEALKNNKLKGETDDDVAKLSPEIIWSDPEILNALRHVLHTGKHKNNDMEMPVDEGASLVCKIYMEMQEQESTKSPLLEKDEALMECLIDVISSSKEEANEDDGEIIVSMYTRVLALQFLTKVCLKRPSLAQTQLLQAPNGLHRLGDLLQIHQEEIIRNEALLLAQVIAEWPSCAKIWMFAEVADQVILLAIEEGGLTGGNLLVQDCLDLLFKLWKHDPSLADLVFQSPTITDNLPRLLDLRKGIEFLNPPKKGAAAKKDDDLDAILKSASAKEEDSNEEKVVVPRLTTAEENVIQKTLDILALLLESDSLKQAVWNRERNLCSLLWELALVSPPPPQVPYVCAVPSPKLQQKALETVALYFHDANSMQRHAGLDRLLYLVCTGGLGGSLDERMGISQAALHVIRKAVSLESASQMLMYTLAPPMNMDDDSGQPPPPTVVHKLLNTVAENLTPTPGIDADKRKVFLAGALGGLSIFLTDQTSREVLLRLTTPESAPSDEDDPDNTTNAITSLVESMLDAVGKMEATQNTEEAFFSMTLLRFLCHWTMETPAVVQAILSSNQSSIVLSALLGIKTKKQSHKKGVAVLGKLLLGLAMEYMGDEEEKCGGWTRASIMELISKKSGGVSKFTSSLEQFKSARDFGSTMPWSLCDLEFKVWAKWFANCVLLVRKRVVQELTGSGDGEDEETDDEGPMGEGDKSQVAASSGSARSLQKVVYQQSQEIDELRDSLEKANLQIKSQDHDLTEYKRRVESAPSQLDNMLDEYSAQISQLESTIAKELEEKDSLVEKHKSDLRKRDDQIAGLQQELEESRAREKEARDETDSVREEIESLSQAYTGLEQEYRQQQSSAPSAASITTTTSEQQPGEQEQEAFQQPQQSNGTAGAGSTESSALRAENERLRGDARAADQWMAMAVEKMQVMGQQNAAFQAELTQLRDGQSQSEADHQYQTLYGEHQSLSSQQGQLQSHLDGVVNENRELNGALRQEQEKHRNLEQRLEGAAAELQSTVSALEESRSQALAAKSEFEGNLEAMSRDLESSTTEINRLMQQLDEQRQIHLARETDAAGSATALAARTEELEQLKATFEAQANDVTALRAEVSQLREQLNQQPQQTNADDTTNDEIDTLKTALENKSLELEALNSDLGTLRLEMDAAISEIEGLRRHEQEEIYHRESKIRELEARLNNGTGGDAGHLADEVKERDNQIAELTGANDAAQEWMKRAVDHHNMLAQQQSKLSSDNAALTAQIRELTAKVSTSEAAVAQAHSIEEESQAQANSLKEAETALQECKSELERVQGELSHLQSQSGDFVQVSAEVESLRGQLSTLNASFGEQVSLAEKLRGDLSAEVASKAALVEEVATLKEKLNEANVLDELSGDVARLKEQIQTLEFDLKDKNIECERLVKEVDTEKESKMAALQEVKSLKERAEQLETEVHSMRPQSESISEDSKKVSELQNELQRVKEANSDLLRAQEDGMGAISRLNEEIASLREAPSSAEVSRTASQQQAKGSTSVEDFFSSSSAIGVSAPVQVPGTGSAQELFSSAPAGAASAQQVPCTGSAQELFSSAQAGAESAQQIFGAAPTGSGAGDAQGFFAVASPSHAQAFFGQSSFDGGTGAQGTEQDVVGSQPTENTSQAEKVEAQLQEARLELETSRQLFAGNETSLRERVSELESTVATLQERLKHEESQCASLEERNSELTASLESSMSMAKEPQSADNALAMELEQTKSKLSEAQARLNEDDGVVLKWQERVTELECLVKDLEEQLAGQEESANSAISQWQESYVAIENRNRELMVSLEAAGTNAASITQETNVNALASLHAELEETKTALAAAQAKLEDDDSVVVKWEERVAGLESAVKDMELQLREQEESANTVIAKWQESCNALEEKNAELLSGLESFGPGEGHREALVEVQQRLQDTEGALAKARDSLRNDDDVVLRWQERVAELESASSEMSTQMAKQEDDARNAIVKWQESCTTLEEQSDNLRHQLEASHEKEHQLGSQLQEAQKDLEEAKASLQEDEESLTKWQERVSELQAIVDNLQAQLVEQEKEAEDVIGKWQESCNALKEQNNQLEQELASSSDNEGALHEKLTDTQKALEEAKHKLKDDEVTLARDQERVSELEEAVKDLETQLGQQEEETKAVIAKWQTTCTALEEQNQNFKSQLQASTENGEALEVQLQEARNGLEEAEKKSKEDEEVLANWQDRVSELETAVSELQTQLSDEKQGAQDAIDKWQESCTSLEGKNAELRQELESTFEMGGSMQKQMEETQRALNEAKDNLQNDEDVVAQWQDRVTELEAVVQNLEATLNEQEEEANTAIGVWQQSYTAMEQKKTELAEEIESSREQSDKLRQEAVSALQQKLEQTEAALIEAQKRFSDADASATQLQEQISLLENAKNDLLEKLKAQEEEASSAASQFQVQVAALEARNHELSRTVDDASERMESSIRSLDDSDVALHAKQAELDAARRALAEASQTISQNEVASQDRIKELESTISELAEQLRSQEADAENVIEQWEQSYKQLQETHAELSQSLEEAETSKQALQFELDAARLALTAATTQANENQDGEADGSVAELKANIRDLELELEASEEEASTVIAQWQDSVAALETNKSELTDALEKATETQQSMQAQVESLQTRLKEVEAVLATAQAEFREESESAFSELQKRLKETQEELRLSQEKLEGLEKDLHAKETSLQETTEKIAGDETVVKEWEKRNSELEMRIQEQNAQMEEQDTEASDAIAKWQERCTELEERCTELESNKNDISQSLEAALGHNKDATDKNNAVALNRAADEALMAEKARANDLKEQLAELESVVNMLQQRLLDGEKAASDAREQFVGLETIVNMLQQKLLDSEKEGSAARERLEEATREHVLKTGELSAKLREAQSKISSLEGSVQSTEATAELEAKVTRLEGDINEKDREMANSVAEWRQHCVDLEKQNTELSNKLEAISCDPDYEGSPQEHIFELEAAVKQLEAEIEEASGVVVSWQESYEALEGRIGELEGELASREQEIQSLNEVKNTAGGDLVNSNGRESDVSELLSKLAASGSTISALQAHCAAKENELLQVLCQLKRALLERDDAVMKLKSKDDDSTSMQDVDVGSEGAPSGQSQQNTRDFQTIQNVPARMNELEQVEELRKERDSATAALASMQESSRSLRQEFEESKAESEDILSQWRARTKEMEDAISDLEVQLEQQVAEATQAIGSWESRCSELEEGLDSRQEELKNCKAALAAVLKDQVQSQEKLLMSYSDNSESGATKQEEAELNVDAMRANISANQALLNDMLAKKENYIKSLFSELEKLRSTSADSPEYLTDENEALQERIDDLLKEVAGKQSSIDELNRSLSLAREEGHAESDYSGMKSKINSLETKIGTLEQEIDDEKFAKEAFEAELWAAKDKLSKFVHSESQVKSELEELKAENVELGRVKAELEHAKSENEELRDSLGAMKHAPEDDQSRGLQQRSESLEHEKVVLEQEVERLSRLTNELQDELQDTNNAMQVYVAKEVSDRATAMASHALRDQLHEIRKQADADRVAYTVEKEAREASEREVERLRTDLFALVDISDQENELYGAAALTIKAADKIHRKERSEITELRKSLTRALEELRTARSAERDAEERAAKAAHHIVVCEQELSAAKSDLKFLIQTMDEMRQDEASRRASLEHRIRTLENDHDVLRRFHSSESDSLRNELTQALLEKDRTLQLLKDSEKNNAAMLYAASKDHPASADEPPEAELARLRIEKAQLIVAAAEEGERTERRLREVIATEVSSAGADVLVERERRLAAEAACNNMKLLVVELQKDVQAYKDDINLGSYSPRKAQMEQENERLRQEIGDLSEESDSLRSKLLAAESAQENANYKIEKLEADCKIAQASSNRLDREIRFHSEVKAEMSRMRTSPQVAKPAQEDLPKEGKTEDDLRTIELYDKIHEQAAAMQSARDVHHALQQEHEDLLALLAQQEEVKRSLENALALAGGQGAVNTALREAEASSISLYGSSVRVRSTE